MTRKDPTWTTHVCGHSVICNRDAGRSTTEKWAELGVDNVNAYCGFRKEGEHAQKRWEEDLFVKTKRVSRVDKYVTDS